jgi:hypothetical protein
MLPQSIIAIIIILFLLLAAQLSTQAASNNFFQQELQMDRVKTLERDFHYCLIESQNLNGWNSGSIYNNKTATAPTRI